MVINDLRLVTGSRVASLSRMGPDNPPQKQAIRASSFHPLPAAIVRKSKAKSPVLRDPCLRLSNRLEDSLDGRTPTQNSSAKRVYVLQQTSLDSHTAEAQESALSARRVMMYAILERSVQMLRAGVQMSNSTESEIIDRN